MSKPSIWHKTRDLLRCLIAARRVIGADASHMKYRATAPACARPKAKASPLEARWRAFAILVLAHAVSAPSEGTAQAVLRPASDSDRQTASIERLLERAEQGLAQAQYDLAVYFASRRSAQPSSERAIRWLRRAAGQGHAQAQADLGLLYHGGLGVPRDSSEAAKWLRHAAEQGHAASQADLGRLYYLGEGVPRDSARAAAWYSKAAEQGLAAAQFNLGGLHAKGDGVARDYAVAARWYREAAEQGLAEAQHALAVELIRGEGVEKDLAAAVRWLQRAAAQGLAGAQLLLARQYETGTGVDRDFAQAARWYIFAADQGLVEAQRSLGRLYRDGPLGVAAPVRGQVWLNIAARNAPEGSQEMIAQERDEAARNMTAAQAAEAERLARHWTRRTWAEIQGSPPVELTTTALSTNLAEFFQSAGQSIAEAQLEYNEYWRPHIEQSRLAILEAARLVREPGTALILGAGGCREIPLEDLARMFDRVVLVDLDAPSMSEAVAQIPRQLRQKVEIRVSDVTSFAEPLMEATARVVEESWTASVAFAGLRSLYGSIDAMKQTPKLPPADLVVSSLVLSELARYPSTYAARLLKERFDTDFSEWRGSGALWRTLREAALEDHAEILARLGRAGSIVYFADTVGRGPDLKWVDGKEKRSALRAVAGRLARLGVFGQFRARPETWGLFRSSFRDLESIRTGAEAPQGRAAKANLELLVAAVEAAPDEPPARAEILAEAATRLLCQDRLPVDIETSAYEVLLDAYVEVEPRTLEQLLDWDRFLAALISRKFEPVRPARSWKWLEYACRIPQAAGGFAVRSVILRNLGE